jgi:hypothetical protein
MNKYAALQRDIFSVFKTQSWLSQGVQTLPWNFTPATFSESYIRLSIIPGHSRINTASSSGVLIVDIFVAAGAGPSPTSVIADKLDTYLVGQSISGAPGTVTQFPEGSSLKHLSADKASPTLLRSSYTIPFKHFGVLQ